MPEYERMNIGRQKRVIKKNNRRENEENSRVYRLRRTLKEVLSELLSGL